MEYGLIGAKLGHSYSPDIHKMMEISDYVLKEIAEKDIEEFLKARDFKGINVTIPYKLTVLPYVDYQDESVKAIGACNTVVNKDGKLTGVKVVKLSPVKDKKTGRMNMEPVEGSEEILQADLVLIAAGFVGAEDYVVDAMQVAKSARGNVEANDSNYETSVPGIYAAGDMRRGQSLVVWAISEGRQVAKKIDESLMGYTNL